ncbi:MAG TPA: response regulator [Candidatus Methanoperedens sp.]|nr:response regulator [Candidatus Methanoperedens sp.]
MSETPLRLLLIEDSEEDALLLLHMLRREGYEVRHRRVEDAAGLSAALDEGGWDLVISDYSLPQFSGPNALALFRQRGLDVPFLVVSGAVGEEAAVALMKAGANDFITKGNLERVPLAVRRELADADVRRRDRRATAEKQELQSQLLQAQKMEAIGVLTAGVAHDFNNILGAIQIYADLALLKTTKGLAPDNELNQVIKATERAAGLARQLLLFSRKQPLELVPLDPAQLVEELMKMLRRIIGERIEVRTEIAADCSRVMGDSGGIEQVIMNLAVNARDAMADGGALTIALGTVEVEESYCVGVLGSRPGTFVRLVVEDSGCGMAPETAQRIFEPFFTTKPAGKGTGLGLSVVYGIVQQHGGWITVRSAPGAGTRFEAYFPVAPVSTAAAAGALRDREDLLGAGERILLVEDEESYRMIVSEALRAHAYAVETAAGVAEATLRLGEARVPYALVFSDVALGDGNGFDLALRVRSLAPGTLVLLTSGYADESSRIPQIRAAGIPFLPKPYALSALLIAIRDLLGQPAPRGKGPPGAPGTEAGRSRSGA